MASAIKSFSVVYPSDYLAASDSLAASQASRNYTIEIYMQGVKAREATKLLEAAQKPRSALGCQSMPQARKPPDSNYRASDSCLSVIAAMPWAIPPYPQTPLVNN